MSLDNVCDSTWRNGKYYWTRLSFNPSPKGCGKCYPRAVWAVAGIKLMGGPKAKFMHGFLPNYLDMYTPKGSSVYQVFGESGNNCCHGNTSKISGS